MLAKFTQFLWLHVSTRLALILSFKKDIQKEDIYVCKSGSTRVQKPKSGFSNLISHLDSAHQNWRDMAENSFKLRMDNATSRNDIRKFIILSDKAQNIYSWTLWVISEDLPLNFCEKDCTKNFTNLDPISFKTLRKYIVVLGVEIEKCIQRSLPEKFGIVMDGWKDGTKHYHAVFAISPTLKTNKLM